MRVITFRAAVAGALLAATLAGCVVAPASGEIVAYSAPPPVRYEVVGVAPAPGYFWVGGTWFWEGGRYAWHSGYWEAPRPGYRWVPHTWRHVNNGWRTAPGYGHWERH